MLKNIGVVDAMEGSVLAGKFQIKESQRSH
jgi:hypothetical protein